MHICMRIMLPSEFETQSWRVFNIVDILTFLILNQSCLIKALGSLKYPFTCFEQHLIKNVYANISI